MASLVSSPTPVTIMDGRLRSFATAVKAKIDSVRSDFASDLGFTLIKYKSAIPNSYARTASQLARLGGVSDDNIFHCIDPGLDDAILAGTNTVDTTPYVQNAINARGASGGRVTVPDAARLLIDSNLTVLPNVSFVGPHQFVGSPQNNASAPYASLGGTLILNPAASITLKGGASVSGLLVYRKGMVFPAPDASAFAGTAFIASGDDVSVSRCLVLGFNQLYSSTGFQRYYLDRVLFDCINGTLIQQCFDIGHILQCHGWPFATIAAAGSADRNKREGTAYRFISGADWCKVENSFSYGYYRGVYGTDVNSMTVGSCGADNTPPATNQHVGAIGCAIDGNSKENRIVGFQAAAQDEGIVINANAGLVNFVEKPDIWYAKTHGLLISGGDCVFDGDGTKIRNCGNGVTLNTTGTLYYYPPQFGTGADANTLDFNNVAGTVIGDYWKTFAPVVGAGGGAITASTVNSFRYRRFRDTLEFEADVTITTNGTGGSSVTVTLPLACVSEYAAIPGREIAINGKALHATINPGEQLCRIRNYDNSYPGADGARFIIRGSYRIA